MSEDDTIPEMIEQFWAALAWAGKHVRGDDCARCGPPWHYALQRNDGADREKADQVIAAYCADPSAAYERFNAEMDDLLAAYREHLNGAAG